jgi:cellulose synthase/poly-beta-1,6-N-acetylglucosamine synthase-like glycosyltransferase
MTAAAVILAAWLLLVLYTYAGYSLALWLLRATGPGHEGAAQGGESPLVTIVIAAYNEERVIGGTLEALLALDYPADRRHILVVSDASTDRTDEIVLGFADRGVELIRLPERSGKTAAENATGRHIRGEIVVNTDASVRIPPHVLSPLVAAFADPSVGVASGRDVSVSGAERDETIGEAGYVGYEMWVRGLETAVGGIVGASGSLYAARAALHQELVPGALSRDLAAPLIARERGLRAVSVREAICYVSRSTSLRQEYRRRVRTVTRGLETLLWKRGLLNPLRFGLFSWKLFSHKLCRWLIPLGLVTALPALCVLALMATWARVVLLLGGSVCVLALGGFLWPARRKVPALLSLPAFGVLGNVAVIHAWINALRRDLKSVWEPTVREEAPGSGPGSGPARRR